MKISVTGGAMLLGTMLTMACQPVSRTVAQAPDDQTAYRPMMAPKPLPPDGYIPGQPLPPQGTNPGAQPGPSLEDAFLQAYVAHRSPRIMVFVNRTIQGDPLPKDGLEEVLRTEVTHTASGAVNASGSNGAGGGGSFVSGGPAAYSNVTSVKKPGDKLDSIGAASEDYSMIEASLVEYFDASGRVQVQDSDAARGKMERGQILRLENGDPAAARLLGVELKQDILIRVTATPTHHAQFGNAVRLIAKCIETDNARNLGTAFVDMPLPMSKTNISTYTRYLTQKMMDDMLRKWAQPADFNPVEIRIYKTASVDDALRVKKWLQATKNVQSVTTRAATGGDKTSYASFMVAYSGSPEDLYADLKDAIGASQGLKAIDVQSNTIDLEVTGKLDLVTTTRKSETITTTTTTNTEDKKVEPINPAPPQQ